MWYKSVLLFSYLFLSTVREVTEISFLVSVTCELPREDYFLATDHFRSKPSCIDCKVLIRLFSHIKGREQQSSVLN